MQQMEAIKEPPLKLTDKLTKMQMKSYRKSGLDCLGPRSLKQGPTKMQMKSYRKSLIESTLLDGLFRLSPEKRRQLLVRVSSKGGRLMDGSPRTPIAPIPVTSSQIYRYLFIRIWSGVVLRMGMGYSRRSIQVWVLF